ncbi:type II toxin-antitoxin system RelE/ParE family toxin [Patescibacteria group bacterium]|nr:type II toxin-antitoxin system RelE/ParE family toxin [Patescibacteria group bacterium]
MKVFLTPSALKQYNLLPENFKLRVRNKLLYLENNPYEGKKLSGRLSEIRSLRVWPYRILYYIDKKSNKIFVVTIAHRQGVYS